MAALRGQPRKDLLARYQGHVRSARHWRDSKGYDKHWDKYVDFYRGAHFPNSGLGEADRIVVNQIFAIINVIAPSVAVNDPKLVVWSQQNECMVNAIVIETLINYWWRHFGFQQELALAVKDFLVVGHGWLKVGWRFVEEAKEKAKLLNKQPLGSDSGKPDSDNLPPQDVPDNPKDDTQEVSGATVDTDIEMEVTQDRPFVERVSFHDIFVDPEAKTEGTAKWIAQKLVKSLAEVKNDDRYRLKARQSLTAGGTSERDPDVNKSKDDVVHDVERVVLWEFYDLVHGTMCVFPDHGDELLLDPIPQPYAFGHPFIMLRNYEVPDFFYPMGDVEALLPIQEELDKTRTQMMNHRKRFDRKYIFRQDAFEKNGISALMLDQDNVMVPTAAPDDMPLNDLIVPLPQTPIDPQMYQYVEMTASDIDKISGVSEFQQGQSPDIRHTATEAAMMSDAANSRAADKLRVVEKCMGMVARRIVQLAQQYMTQDTEARVMGKNGYPVWIPCSPEHIQGEYAFEVEAGSTKPLNESQRRSDAMQLLQTLMPMAGSGLINVPELVKYVLTQGFGIKDADRFLSPQQGQPQQPGPGKSGSPRQSLVETINYKDAPPDIQRQIEQAAGLQPSQVGGSSPAEQQVGQAMQPQIQQAAQAPQQAQLQQMKSQADLQKQHAQHIHEASLKHEDRKHAHEVEQTKHEHRVVEGVQDAGQDMVQGAQQAEQQHGQAMEQGAQQQQGQMMQTMMGAAMQPPEQPEPTEGSE